LPEITTNGRPKQPIPDEIGKLPAGWYDQRDDAKKQADGDVPVCGCAEAFTRCKRALNDHVVCHHSELKFDSDTFVSEARESVILKASKAEAAALIDGGRPWNWARDGGGDLFDETMVCSASGEPVQAYRGGGEFFLREKTSWQINRDLAAKSDIVLCIEGYDERPRTKDQLRLRFDYRLRECLETQFWVARSRGGIDLDEGTSEVVWVPDPKGGEEGLLHIHASKRLRFSQTREMGREEVLLLNMMAPAILSTMLQELAFNRPLEIVSADAGAALGSGWGGGGTVPSQPPPKSTPRLSGGRSEGDSRMEIGELRERVSKQ
jgi:hypothetical protein